MKHPQNQPVPVKDRFWEKVDKKGPDDCWEWIGARSSKGYGTLGGPNGTTLSSHRVAYELTFGPIPLGKQILHECDNPPCCNPSHLFLGTNRENRLDCVRKGRANSCNDHTKGSHHGFLSAEQIPELRALHASGVSLVEIGKRFGVHSTTIWGALHGKTFRHVHPPVEVM